MYAAFTLLLAQARQSGILICMSEDPPITVQIACAQFPGLHVRTAQRRIAAGYERVQRGVAEPGDDAILYLGKTFSAPVSWWEHELGRRPLKRPGRPPETSVEMPATKSD